MKRELSAGAAVALMFVVAGCTTLRVQRLDETGNTPTACRKWWKCGSEAALPGAPAKGWHYNLPYARYKISIVRTVKKCSPNVELKISATSTPLMEPDPSQSFAIDNESLRNAFKTSELSIERHENGMLKSIGGSATDMTGKVITNTVSGFIKLAEAAARSQAPLPFDAFVQDLSRYPRATLDCNTKVRQTLEGGANQQSLDKLREALSKANARLSGEAKRLKLLGDAVLTFGKAPTERIQDQVIGQANEVAKAQIEVDQSQTVYQEALETVTDVETFTWPDDGQTVNGYYERPYGEHLGLLLNGTAEALKNFERVRARIIPRHAHTLEKGELPTTSTCDTDGIRYRDPQPGALEIAVCKSPADDPNDSKLGCDPETIGFPDSPVPQFGRLMLLPYKNGVFQSNTIKATFAPDGSLVSSSYAETVSRAEVASDTFNQVAGSLLEGVKSIQAVATANQNAETNAKTAEINAKVSQLEAQAKLSKALLALQPAGTEANAHEAALIASDTELKKAQLANLEAAKALADALLPKPDAAQQ